MIEDLFEEYLFTGKAIGKIDNKGRVKIPSIFLKFNVRKVFLYKANEKFYLSFYKPEIMKKYLKKIYGQKRIDFFSNFYEINKDKYNRILIPKEIRNDKKEILFLGNGKDIAIKFK